MSASDVASALETPSNRGQKNPKVRHFGVLYVDTFYTINQALFLAISSILILIIILLHNSLLRHYKVHPPLLHHHKIHHRIPHQNYH